MQAALKKCLITALLLSTPVMVSAQAWTPPAGQGTVWISEQRLHVYAHLQGNKVTDQFLDVDSNSLILGLDYGLTDRLAIAANLPYVRSRLNSGPAHAGSISDDGRSHGTPTDLYVELRYKAVDSRVVLTPLISVTEPIHDYEALGHAAPGRGLYEYAAGFDVAYNVISISPSLYAGGAYRYTYVERIDERITVDRSNAETGLDYLVTPRFGIRAGVNWQKTYGGLELPLFLDPPEVRRGHVHNHDQLARADFWHASLGASYGLSPDIDLFASWSTVLQGVNTHAFKAWSAGIAWRFDAKRGQNKIPSSIYGQ